MSATEQQATNEARPVDASQAKDLVAAVSRQLNGHDSTPVAALPVGNTPLAQLATLASRSTQNEKRFGKAGACEDLASALEARLAGNGPLSLNTLHDICVSMITLVATCAKNVVAFGQLGVISNATRALRIAARESDWRLMETSLILLSKLAMGKEASHCEQFGAAGTFEAVAECVVMGGSCPDGAFAAEFAGFRACNTLHELQHMATACRDRGCENAQKFARVPGLPTALDRWLQKAITHASLDAELARRSPEVMSAIRDASSYAIRDPTMSLLLVVHAFQALVQRQPGGLPEAQVRTLATPRVCQNLVRALALAGAPEYLARPTSPILKEWLLLASVTNVIMEVCGVCKDGIPAGLVPAADLMVHILKDANH
eukprot:jgi/Mesvir1/15524/Mv03176-RA.1